MDRNIIMHAGTGHSIFDLEDNKSYSDGNNHSAYHYKKYYVDITKHNR